eukprot:65912_1
MSQPNALPAASAASKPQGTSQQPVLKVMRLYRPRFSGAQIVSGTMAGEGHHELSRYPYQTYGGLSDGLEGDFILSDILKLPDSFSKVYNGEMFVAYIGVINHNPCTLLQVEVNATIQCPSSRADLYDVRIKRGATYQPPNPAPVLAQGEKIDMIIEHCLREAGTHTLRISVSYREAGSTASMESTVLPKFYRFAVLDPLHVTLSSYSVKRSGGGDDYALVRAFVRNSTSKSIILDSFEFIPEVDSNLSAELIGGAQAMVPHIVPIGSPFVQTRKSSVSERGVTEVLMDILSNSVLLDPGDMHSLVYRLDGSQGFTTSSTAYNLGFIEFCWHMVMGENGSILSEPVVLRSDSRHHLEANIPVEVCVTSRMPDSLRLGETCTCKLTVTNWTESSMCLQLQFRTQEMAGLAIEGRSHQDLGELGPGDSKSTTVCLLPLVAGLHELSGCYVVDMRTTREFKQCSLANLLISIPD